jgi:hypothetical protein
MNTDIKKDKKSKRKMKISDTVTLFIQPHIEDFDNVNPL